MDIKETIEKIVDAVKKDDNLLEQFQKEPVKAIEKIIGIDLPDDIVEKVIEGVKGKITLDKAADALGMLKKLF